MGIEIPRQEGRNSKAFSKGVGAKFNGQRGRFIEKSFQVLIAPVRITVLAYRIGSVFDQINHAMPTVRSHIFLAWRRMLGLGKHSRVVKPQIYNKRLKRGVNIGEKSTVNNASAGSPREEFYKGKSPDGFMIRLLIQYLRPILTGIQTTGLHASNPS
ncbi:hypothetical protein VNO77_34131 [Canavalia gladiata]|uniref:Uncharacterized protein n=1 Tax=Canavalia gladiata TaxID=3824 RepID=A0AAN9PWZ9_CANGL